METAAQIEELERQLRQLKARQLLELRVKLAEAKGLVVSLEKRLREFEDTGGFQMPVGDCRKTALMPPRPLAAIVQEKNAVPAAADASPRIAVRSPQPTPAQNVEAGVDCSEPDRQEGANVRTTLVLGRRAGQTIMIGDNIEVTVAEIDHDRVTLRFRAPRDIPVFRGELYHEMEHIGFIHPGQPLVPSVAGGPCRKVFFVREVGESVMIGDEIEIVVSRIDRGPLPQMDNARIRICAPRKIRIFREELYRDIIREKSGRS